MSDDDLDDLQDKGNLAAEPLQNDDLLSALPPELQLHVANAVGERCDRAALALASPRLLGLAACRQLPSYQGLEMSLAIDEQLLRRYVRRSDATPEGCKRLAGVAGLQISCSGRSRPRWSRWSGEPSRSAATARLQIRVIVSDTEQRWYLIRPKRWYLIDARGVGCGIEYEVSDCTVGALLRHGGPRAGTVRHYKGEEGAERLVRSEEPDGKVGHFEGERGAERVVRVDGLPGGEVQHYEGEKGAERCVRVEQLPSNHGVFHLEGETGAERQVRHERPDGGVDQGPAATEPSRRRSAGAVLSAGLARVFISPARRSSTPSAALPLRRAALPLRRSSLPADDDPLAKFLRNADAYALAHPTI